MEQVYSTPVRVESTSAGLSVRCTECGWTEQIPSESPSTGFARSVAKFADGHLGDHGLYEVDGV